MEPTAPDSAPEPAPRKGFSGLQVLGIVFLVMVVTAGITGFVVWRWVFPPPFEAVVLDTEEQEVLEQKLGQLGVQMDTSSDLRRPDQPVSEFNADGSLRPEQYSEAGASREVSFSERELNALLANNTNLADKLAIDLSDDLASARLLVPMDPDFPIFGGKTLRVNAGVEIAFRQARPMVKLVGVSVMGVPIPNVWLGGLKNVDLASEFGGDPGLWQGVLAGVEYVEVRDGRLTVKLTE